MLNIQLFETIKVQGCVDLPQEILSIAKFVFLAE